MRGVRLDRGFAIFRNWCCEEEEEEEEETEEEWGGGEREQGREVEKKERYFSSLPKVNFFIPKKYDVIKEEEQMAVSSGLIMNTYGLLFSFTFHCMCVCVCVCVRVNCHTDNEHLVSPKLCHCTMTQT